MSQPTKGEQYHGRFELYSRRDAGHHEDHFEAIRDAASMNKDAREKLLSEAGVGDALQVVNKELCEKIPRIQKNGNITFVPQMRQAIHAPVLVTDEDEHNASEVEAAK